MDGWMDGGWKDIEPHLEPDTPGGTGSIALIHHNSIIMLAAFDFNLS